MAASSKKKAKKPSPASRASRGKSAKKKTTKKRRAPAKSSRKASSKKSARKKTVKKKAPRKKVAKKKTVKKKVAGKKATKRTTGKKVAKKTTTKKSPKKVAKKSAARAGKRTGARSTPTSTSTARKVVRTAGTSVAQKTVARKANPGLGAPTFNLRNPRRLQTIKNLPAGEQEEYFERIELDELVSLLEESYPSDFANLLMDLKKYTCRRLLEMAVGHRKRAYLDTITLYYYKLYLTNPLPLEIVDTSGANIPNYHALLGVPRDATVAEIAEASRLLIHAFQPENFPAGDRRMSEIRLAEIRDAARNLKSDTRREELETLLPSIHYLYPRRELSWLGMVQRLFL